MCPPAWRKSTPFQSPMGADESSQTEIPTTKNTNTPKSKKRVSPDKIRAERSEQEVAVPAFFPEPNFPISLNTAGQAGHGTPKPLS